MPESNTYYLGRISKLGSLTHEMIESAILAPETTVWWSNGWSFFDAERHEYDGVTFLCAKLSKFNPDGEVIIADPRSRQEVVQSEPNLRIASSYFIYIPSMAGIAFTKVYNHIDEFQFCRRFAQVINETHNNFFVDCEINLIADLHTFAQKLLSLESIIRITATLNPPNPIWGPLWKPLRDYIKMRRADKMIIREEASKEVPLNTELPQHVQASAEQTPENEYLPDAELPIGDAAILMAADGYGVGTVKGLKAGETIVIRTTETIRNITFARDHSPRELFERVYKSFVQIDKDRHMEH